MSGGTHLRLEEREWLAVLKAEGLSLRAIAARLGRAASTVSRELRRNALPRGSHLPLHADLDAVAVGDDRLKAGAILSGDGEAERLCHAVRVAQPRSELNPQNASVH